LGDHHFVAEISFTDADAALSTIREEGFTQVLFFNPYANAHRMGLYKALRKAGIRTIVFERGALPDSWFFDRSGFLAHSTNYAPDLWDHTLDKDRAERTKQWMLDLRYSNQTLESNGERLACPYKVVRFHS
jgi:hypothetical protein